MFFGWSIWPLNSHSCTGTFSAGSSSVQDLVKQILMKVYADFLPWSKRTGMCIAATPTLIVQRTMDCETVTQSRWSSPLLHKILWQSPCWRTMCRLKKHLPPAIQSCDDPGDSRLSPVVKVTYDSDSTPLLNNPIHGLAKRAQMERERASMFLRKSCSRRFKLHLKN